MYIEKLVPSVEVKREGELFSVSSFRVLDKTLAQHATALGLPLSDKGIALEYEYGPSSVLISENRIKVVGPEEDMLRMGLNYIAQLYYGTGYKLPEGLFAFSSPAFSYRGFMLDTVRHFMPVDEIKRFLRTNALFGYNRFHFHLTDDQGWRFTVPGYPLLEEISSKRKDLEYKGRIYEGIYSDEDLREIVEYAASLGIMVIPEVEMPGHATALLAAYPEFGCTGKRVEVETGWGIFEDVMNPFSPSLWIFLEDVVRKLCTVFPSPYIHIGGDECPHIQWIENEEIKKEMDALGLKNGKEAQGYFTSKASHLVAEYGKRAIGWDEVLEAPDIDKNVIVMSWRGREGAIEAAKRGHETILTPSNGGGCYFDWAQSNADYEMGNLGIAPISMTYALDISTPEIPEEDKHLIMGGQWNLWAEKVTSGRMAEYLAYPRAIALAEGLWRGNDKESFLVFKFRKGFIEDMLSALDIAFCPTPW